MRLAAIPLRMASRRALVSVCSRCTHSHSSSDTMRSDSSVVLTHCSESPTCSLVRRRAYSPPEHVAVGIATAAVQRMSAMFAARPLTAGSRQLRWGRLLPRATTSPGNRAGIAACPTPAKEPANHCMACSRTAPGGPHPTARADSSPVAPYSLKATLMRQWHVMDAPVVSASRAPGQHAAIQRLVAPPIRYLEETTDSPVEEFHGTRC